MGIDQTTLDAASYAGELLIRAAAVLGTLSAEQQEALRIATDGGMPESIIFALRGAKMVSPQIAESMKAHPPSGLATAHDPLKHADVDAMAGHVVDVINQTCGFKPIN